MRVKVHIKIIKINKLIIKPGSLKYHHHLDRFLYISLVGMKNGDLLIKE